MYVENKPSGTLYRSNLVCRNHYRSVGSGPPRDVNDAMLRSYSKCVPEKDDKVIPKDTVGVPGGYQGGCLGDTGGIPEGNREDTLGRSFCQTTPFSWIRRSGGQFARSRPGGNYATQTWYVIKTSALMAPAQ